MQLIASLNYTCRHHNKVWILVVDEQWKHLGPYAAAVEAANVFAFRMWATCQLHVTYLYIRGLPVCKVTNP